MVDDTKSALDELLGDPMVQMVMARDGVRPEDLRAALERDRRRYSGQRVVASVRMNPACEASGLGC